MFQFIETAIDNNIKIEKNGILYSCCRFILCFLWLLNVQRKWGFASVILLVVDISFWKFYEHFLVYKWHRVFIYFIEGIWYLMVLGWFIVFWIIGFQDIKVSACFLFLEQGNDLLFAFKTGFCTSTWDYLVLSCRLGLNGWLNSACYLWLVWLEFDRLPSYWYNYCPIWCDQFPCQLLFFFPINFLSSTSELLTLETGS